METARRRHAGAAGLAFASAILVIFAFSCVESKPARARTPGDASGPASAPAHAPASGPAQAVASHALFNYEEKDPTGPDQWAKLNKAWAACGDGKKQSPIDICKVKIDKDMGPLEQTYNSSACTLKNRGHDFILQWKGGNGKLTIKKKDYVLQQVHWHVPSEHTVNGTRFDMELHMVHEDSSKARAVISVLYSTKEAGDPDKTLTDLAPYFKRLAGKDNEDEDVKEPVDPSVWIDKASGYYRYDGSLTTPPCTEGVLWNILSKVKHVSKEHIKMMESVSEEPEPNDRPAQKMNGRVVRYFEGEEAKD
ncbi:hypothetical protein CFC21_066109 [Triticum aestivum]|uniref:Carbonic anhydrase n=2 Tax=Triticum aestivum TaxID=4565 RepID=A0A9R1H579_WHEAT|nr:alpha carbonic anhydrase 7-like [Triticum aestivum]KAF7059174.1 hypothetical protein CFC21_066109 [Triticum aestivum]